MNIPLNTSTKAPVENEEYRRCIRSFIDELDDERALKSIYTMASVWRKGRVRSDVRVKHAPAHAGSLREKAGKMLEVLDVEAPVNINWNLKDLWIGALVKALKAVNEEGGAH